MEMKSIIIVHSFFLAGGGFQKLTGGREGELIEKSFPGGCDVHVFRLGFATRASRSCFGRSLACMLIVECIKASCLWEI